MIYSFDTELAKKYGVSESIVLNNFLFWIKKNIANNTNYYDDNWWTYNSARAFCELFPFWSESQIRRVIKSLVDKGVLIEGCYNQNAYDRTKWYAISNDCFCMMDVTKSSNGCDETITPIPDNKPNKKQDISFSEFKDKFDFINEESFLMLLSHFKAKYGNVTKARITNNIKKLKDNPTMFTKAVEKMIELDYSGLFVPSYQDKKIKVQDGAYSPKHQIHNGKKRADF